MAGRKKTLNPLTDTPTSKVDITKPYMKAFMRSEKATKEDVVWFITLCKNPEYRKDYENKFAKEGEPKTYNDIDIPKVREEFCKKFFPNLVEKKGKKTFTDELDEILKDK